jgi:hypothetical protein
MMKYRIRLIATFMIIAIASLGMSGWETADAVTVAPPEFCEDCAAGCWNEARYGYNWRINYWECIQDNGGETLWSQTFCYETVVVGYYNACLTMFCNNAGCSIPRKVQRIPPSSL